MYFESPKSDTKRESYDQNTEGCAESKLCARECNFPYLIQTLLEDNLDVNFDLIFIILEADKEKKESGIYVEEQDFITWIRN